MEDMKVPPGWVRLTLIEDGETGPHDIRASAIVSYGEYFKNGALFSTRIMVNGITRVTDYCGFVGAFDVTESPAEVARQIAEAEAAERRARALPVMAAILGTRDRPGGEQNSYNRASAWAVRYADAILDAIEARGEGE